MTGESRRVTGKALITVQWVDVNKGDNANPNIRSRLVARQIRKLVKTLDLHQHHP